MPAAAPGAGYPVGSFGPPPSSVWLGLPELPAQPLDVTRTMTNWQIKGNGCPPSPPTAHSRQSSLQVCDAGVPSCVVVEGSENQIARHIEKQMEMQVVRTEWIVVQALERALCVSRSADNPCRGRVRRQRLRNAVRERLPGARLPEQLHCLLAATCAHATSLYDHHSYMKS